MWFKYEPLLCTVEYPIVVYYIFLFYQQTIFKVCLLRMVSRVFRKSQHKDVYRRKIEISQNTRIFRLIAV